MNLKLAPLFYTTIWAVLLLSCSDHSEGHSAWSHDFATDMEGRSHVVRTLPDSVDTTRYTLKALSFSNPYTSTNEQAKFEIYQMALTPKHWKWQNPTTGGAVHINSAGQVEVYQFTLGRVCKGRQGDSYESVELIKGDTAVVVRVADILSNVGGVGYGNETSVLLTSEIPPLDARVFQEVLEVLYRTGIQLYYLKEESSTPLDEMSK